MKICNIKENDANSKDYYGCIRNEMLKYLPQNAKKILDVGCGEACFSFLVKQKNNAEVWGIELNRNAAEASKEKIDKVIIGNITDKIDELPNNYFDCIYFNDVLEHLYDPYSILKKIKSKLTSDGIIICSLPNIRYISVLKDLILHKEWKYVDSGPLDFTHLRFFTKKTIIEMFKQLDYSITYLEGINGDINFKQVLFLDLLCFGFFSDVKYPQFACVVKPKI